MSIDVLKRLSLNQKLLLGSFVIGAMLPATAFAQVSGAEHPLNTGVPVYMTQTYVDVSGPERPLNSSKLPFLKETSKQYMGGAVTGQVGAEGLLSQTNNCRFKDIDTHRSVKAINYLYDRGVVGGRSACFFDPNAVATRAEATTMAVRAAKVMMPVSAEPKAFVDLDLKASSAKHVKAAKNANIVHGYPDSKFRPEKAVNVAESLKIVTRSFKSDFSKVNPQLPKSNIAMDQWYAQYVNAGFNEGLLESNSTRIDLMTQVTRAELAEMIFTLMESRKY